MQFGATQIEYNIALLPFIGDGIRLSDANRRQLLHDLMRFDYEALGYGVVEIDGKSPELRARQLRELLPDPPDKASLGEIKHDISIFNKLIRQQIRLKWSEALDRNE